MPSNPYSFKCFWSLRVLQTIKPLQYQVFLVFEGASGLQTLILSSVSGFLGCYRPSNHYTFKCFWTFRVPQAFKPLWFKVFLDFEGVTGQQTLIVSSVTGLLCCYRPSNPYSFKCFWTFGSLVQSMCTGAAGHQVLAVAAIRTKSPETLETIKV